MARVYFFLLLAACVYSSYVVWFRADDWTLLTNRGLSRIVGGLPASWFFVAAPLLILFMYALFLRIVQRLWETLVELPAKFPDGKTLNMKVSDWFLAAVAYPLLPGEGKIRARRWGRVLNLLTRGVVPLAQLLFWLRYLPQREWRFTLFHIFVVAVTVALGWSYRRRGEKILLTNNTGEHWQGGARTDAGDS